MDPVADMFSAIRNAIMRRKDYVDVPSSKLKEAILNVLQREGYILKWERLDSEEHRNKKTKSVIRGIVKVSKPGRRIYVPKHLVPHVRKGLGIAILSTDAGVITDHEARKLGKGGEVIAYVW